MRARRWAAIGTALLVAASAAACSATAPDTTVPSQVAPPPASIPADPALALAAAKAALGRESAHFSLTTGAELSTYAGTVNAETKNWEITGKAFVVRRVGTDLYVKMSGKALDLMLVPPDTTAHLAAGGWVHTRLPNGRELTTTFNDEFPWNLASSAFRATGMTKTGDRAYSGKLTVKDNRPRATPSPDRNAKVTAGLDPQGRIAEIGFGAGAEKSIIRFFDYGTTADVIAPPASEVVEQDNPSFLAATLLP